MREFDIDGKESFSHTAALDIDDTEVLRFRGGLAVDTMSYAQQVTDASGETHWDYFPASTQIGVDLDSVVLTFTMAPVPEPTGWLMLLAGLGLVGATTAARSRRS